MTLRPHAQSGLPQLLMAYPLLAHGQRGISGTLKFFLLFRLDTG
jgi:hypothetical protein